MSEDRLTSQFPIMPSKGTPSPPHIPWSVAEKAYSQYVAEYGKGQSLITISQRGGFYADEMDTLYPEWKQEASEVTALQSEVERFQQKDGLRTREHNILVQENRNLTATIATLRELGLVTSRCAHVVSNHSAPFETCQVQACTDWREILATAQEEK